MSGWLIFWTALLLIGVGGYAVLAALITIGGFFNVLEMFRALKASHAANVENPQQSSTESSCNSSSDNT